MRLLARLCIPVTAVHLIAADVNPKVFRLIGPDARSVAGMDFERYRLSALPNFFPMGSPHGNPAETGRVIRITNDPAEAAPIIVFLGQPPTDSVAVLDPGTSISGDAASVKAASRRWKQEDRLGELGIKAQRLSETYDAWFLLVRPLDQSTPDRPAPALKYRKDIVQLVEEVSGGIRFGSFNDVRIEILAKTSEDATALAILGRYLPGLFQVADNPGEQGLLVELIDDLEIRAANRTVSVSFTLAESKLKELMATMLEKKLVGK